MAFLASIWSLVGRCRGLHNNCRRKYRLPSLVCHGKFAHPITDPHSHTREDTGKPAISKRNLFLSCNCCLSNQNPRFVGKSNTHPWIYERLKNDVICKVKILTWKGKVDESNRSSVTFFSFTLSISNDQKKHTNPFYSWFQDQKARHQSKTSRL